MYKLNSQFNLALFMYYKFFLAFHSCVSISSPLEGVAPFNFQTPVTKEDGRGPLWLVCLH